MRRIRTIIRALLTPQRKLLLQLMDQTQAGIAGLREHIETVEMLIDYHRYAYDPRPDLVADLVRNLAESKQILAGMEEYRTTLAGQIAELEEAR